MVHLRPNHLLSAFIFAGRQQTIESEMCFPRVHISLFWMYFSTQDDESGSNYEEWRVHFAFYLGQWHGKTERSLLNSGNLPSIILSCNKCETIPGRKMSLTVPFSQDKYCIALLKTRIHHPLLINLCVYQKGKDFKCIIKIPNFPSSKWYMAIKESSKSAIGLYFERLTRKERHLNTITGLVTYSENQRTRPAFI